MSDLPIAPPVEDAPQTDTDEGGTTDRLGELLPYFGERPLHAQPDWLLVHAMDLDAQGVSRRADGKVIFIVAAVSFVLMWIYGAYVAGDAAAAYNFDGGREYNVGRFFIDLLLTAPYCVLQIGLVRLFIELVRGSARRAQA